MAKKVTNYGKLGMFVMAGIAFLVLLLYVIGKNQNLFGKTFTLKARFSNIQGLMAGDNIRFAGIDAGSVKDLEVINDTTIEVTLLVKKSLQPYIRKNASVSINTDGLIGNKVVNIESAKTPAELVEEGDLLNTIKGLDTDEMIKVLNNTNNDIAIVARELKQTIHRFNSSKALWDILEDESLPQNIASSLSRIRKSTIYLDGMMQDLNLIVSDVKSGKGSIGELLADTTMADDVKATVAQLKTIGANADTLIGRVTQLVSEIRTEVNDGKGTVNALLKDKEMADRLNRTMKNLEADTKSFNEVMDAIKHSFLFRGYFKKLEKEKKQQPGSTTRY